MNQYNADEDKVIFVKNESTGIQVDVVQLISGLMQISIPVIIVKVIAVTWFPKLVPWILSLL